MSRGHYAIEGMKNYDINTIVFFIIRNRLQSWWNTAFSQNHPDRACHNPYGRGKYMVEEILRDMAFSNEKLLYHIAIF